MGKHRRFLAHACACDATTLRDYNKEQIIIGIRAENMETFNTSTDDALLITGGEPLGSRTCSPSKSATALSSKYRRIPFQIAPDEDVITLSGR